MIPLRVIDLDFNFFGEVPKYESLQVTKKLFGVGEIELKINRYMTNADLLQTDRIIFPLNQLDNAYQIQYKEIELDDDGKATENWHIKAVSLNSWLSDRIIMPPVNKSNHDINDNAETVMKEYVKMNAVTPVDTKRKFPNFTIATDLKRGDKISRSARFDTLSEELQTIGELTKVGWGIRVDLRNKAFIFDVICGENKVYNQRERPPVVFSTEFKTLESLSYTESKLDYKNTALVAGQGEGVQRKIIILNNDNVGYNRKEMYVDARDIEDTISDDDGNERPRPQADIEKDLTDRGNEKLSEHAQQLFVNGQIVNSRFKYRDDWAIGDTVTCQHTSWGITIDAQITEVKEIHESGQIYKIEVVFDKDLPTFIDKIKRSIKQVPDKR